MDSFAASATASLEASISAEPATATWLLRSTREVPPRDRFDFWRSLAIGVHAERPLVARRDFLGDVRYAAAPDGVGFADMNLDPCIAKFGPGGDSATVDLGLIRAGTMHLRHGRDETLVLDATTGPVLFDPTRPMTTATSRCDLSFLRLPRAAVVEAIGGAAMRHGGAVRPLAPGPLAAELTTCVWNLQRAAQRDVAAPMTVLETAGALALVALARNRDDRHRWPGALRTALYRVARHELARHAADPAMTADALAHTLGCSRAALYRLFAAHGTSVAGYLHEMRMQRAAALLRSRPRVAIGAIALECSYAEPAAFSKAFRRRFGMTPGDWRVRATNDIDQGEIFSATTSD